MLTDVSQLFPVLDRSSSPKSREVADEFEILGVLENGDDDKAYIRHESDLKVYDSGKMLTVVYNRNENEPDAIENLLLDYDESKGDYDKEGYVLHVLDDVFPSISFFYPTVTRITLKTVEGKLTHTVTEDLEEIFAYLPIPPHLSHIPTVPLSEIRKVKMIDMDVDRVQWNGQLYAFKKTVGEFIKATLKELTILDQLRDSPNVIDLAAIVVNPNGTIRGFLMPYMQAKDLGNVFKIARRDQGLADDKLSLDWSIKLTWARQFVQGVVELHAIAAYNGDLTPRNIVIGPEGQAILIDFLPIGYSPEFAAPELLAVVPAEDISYDSLLNGPGDIYSLGLILYALAQEKASGIARVQLAWSDGPGSAPNWYRGVVQRCLHIDPIARPSAVEVLSILKAGEL